MWILKLRRIARQAGREALILYFALLDPATPMTLKIATVAALGYLVSPVDLIPDVLLIGLVDDLLLLSFGLPFLVRSLPAGVRAAASARADGVIVALGLGATKGASHRADTAKGQDGAVEEGRKPRGRDAKAGPDAAHSRARRPSARRRSAGRADDVSDATIVSGSDPSEPERIADKKGKDRRRPAG